MKNRAEDVFNRIQNHAKKSGLPLTDKYVNRLTNNQQKYNVDIVIEAIDIIAYLEEDENLSWNDTPHNKPDGEEQKNNYVVSECIIDYIGTKVQILQSNSSDRILYIAMVIEQDHDDNITQRTIICSGTDFNAVKSNAIKHFNDFSIEHHMSGMLLNYRQHLLQYNRRFQCESDYGFEGELIDWEILVEKTI